LSDLTVERDLEHDRDPFLLAVALHPIVSDPIAVDNHADRDPERAGDPDRSP